MTSLVAVAGQSRRGKHPVSGTATNAAPVNIGSAVLQPTMGAASRNQARSGGSIDRVTAGSDEHEIGGLVIITGLPGSGKTTLATELATAMPAVRMSPDDWMMSAGIDLWNASVRSRIERFQFDLMLDLLRTGDNVIIEWGVWTRKERDELRDAARAVGASVELQYVTASVDELWRRIVERNFDGRWDSRPIRRDELEEWAAAYEEPTDEEFSTYDTPRTA
jgi:predicted kinase